MVKRLSTMRETLVRALGWEDALEKEMSIHSSTIAWKIPWTEEPGRLQSMESQSHKEMINKQQRQQKKKKRLFPLKSTSSDRIENTCSFRSLVLLWFIHIDQKVLET